MKVPLSWLQEYIPTQLSVEQIAATLTSIGLEVEGVEDDVLEIALTPNLSYAANVRGVARELAAVTGENVHYPKFSVIEKSQDKVESHTSVRVENGAACPRYACRLIRGVRVGPSPDWLQKRLEKSGMRSVNVVVDITNLTLFELGQPLHAFDFDRLEGGQVVVRNAHKGETITTLDGVVRYPTEETLLICDRQKPVAIAGVMGSQESEVSDGTTTVLLESAYFTPSQVRRAAKRMDLRSEASYRFERGCDPNGVIEALDRATAWICEIAGGTALQGVLDVQQREFAPVEIACRLSRINQLLGTQLGRGEVETLFRSLGFTIAHVSEDKITVKVPTYRHDLLQEIDLIEEVARLYGFDNLHKGVRAFYRTGALPDSPEYVFTKAIRTLLLEEGLQEFLTCDLISPEQGSWISTDTFPTRNLIKLLNPSSEAQSLMRPSLLPGMLSTLRYNSDHGIESVAAFEVGRVHFTSKDRFFEPPVAAIILTGGKAPYHWESGENPVDFYDLKGIVENLLQGLKVAPFSFEPSHYANFHPGQQAAILINQVEAGIMGAIHPRTLKQAGLEKPVFYAEINLEDVQPFVKSELKMEPLPLFPASARDWTVTVADAIPVGPIIDMCLKHPSELLESVTLRAIYKDPALGNKKNVTFRFVYRDKQKTVSLADVEQEHLKITKAISEYLSQGESP